MVDCHHVYYNTPDPPSEWEHQEARHAAHWDGASFAMTPVDQTVTFPHEDGEMTITLRCVENCNNVNCTTGCDDGNPCTTDSCEPGRGCVYDPQTGGPCTVDICTTEGACQQGVCTGGEPVDCDDQNECTEDFCTPEWGFGCVNAEDNKPVDNPFNDDCTQVICFAGEYMEDAPADMETPPQFAPDDCERQVCYGGEIATIDDFSEPGCP